MLMGVLMAFAVMPMTAAIVFAQDPSAVDTGLIVVEQPAAISVVEKDKGVTLCFEAKKDDDEASYQWFQSTDGTLENSEAIEGATEGSLTTGIFEEKDIRYYFCVATVGEESVTSEVAAVACTGLPVLYINTEIPKENIGKEEYVFGGMRLAYGNGSNDFVYTFMKEKNGEKKEGIKGRGNTTWQMDKKGYDIKFDKKQALFSHAAAEKWCIRANYADKTLLRNVYASLLAKNIFNSEWNPSFHPVEVVWDGVYQGNYILCERNTVGNGRVNVQNISDCSEEAIENGDFADQNGDGLYDLNDGGFLLEIDAWRDAEFWFETEKAKAPVALRDPDEASEDVQEHVKDCVQIAENVLYSDGFKDVENGWRKYFDEDSVIDWFLVNEIARNHDAKDISSIYKFYDPVYGKLHYGPIWDFDVGFGNDGEGKAAAVTGWYVKNGFWTSRMFEDPLFVQNVIERWNENKEALDASLEDLLTLAANNSVSAECNFMKWDILGKKVHMDSAGYEERLTYESEVEYMKTWLEDRIAWIDAALNDSYFISYELDGGSLPVSNPDMFLCGDTEEFQLNNPVREGYVFAGWSGKGIDGMSETVRLTDDKLGDREYKANWKKDIAFGNAHLAESEATYSGAGLTPDVIVSLNDETLVPEKDYVVKYEDNIDVGPATVTITGTGDYGGILEKTFTITPAPLTIRAKDQTYEYDGQPHGEGDTAYDDPAVIAGKVEAKGLQGSDVITSLILDGAETEIGEYKDRIQINGFTINGKPEAKDNYNVTLLPGTLTITKPQPQPQTETDKVAPKAMTAKGKNALTIHWRKVSGAQGYDIFFSICGGDRKCKLTKTINGNKTFSWTKTGLKTKTPYKAYVKGWVMKDGKKIYISTSPTLHLYTANGTNNYTVAKSIKVKKTKVKLNAGKVYKIKAKIIKRDKTKKLMPATHTKQLRYISTNKKIATVSKSGKIKAKAKGSCKIYVYAANGVSKAVKVTVR